MVNNMDFIPITPPPSRPEIESIAQGELAHVNAALARRIDEHKARFVAFWRNWNHTPDSILEAMGSSAIIWLSSASESVNHIGRLASIVGKTVGDFLPSEYITPPRAFVIGSDYSVTIDAPAEGYDAWGRPVNPPSPGIE
jgi:hypothetical protein